MVNLSYVVIGIEDNEIRDNEDLDVVMYGKNIFMFSNGLIGYVMNNSFIIIKNYGEMNKEKL